MGYFRIFYYITYILNFILRLIKRHGKAVLWFICIAVFLVICMYNPKSNAVYIGDYDYGDPNYAIKLQYDSICLDFLRRIDHLGEDVRNYYKDNLNRQDRDLYIYYITANNNNSFYGQDMLNGAPLKTNYIATLWISKSNAGISVGPSLYDNYMGVDCDIKNVTFTQDSYRFLAYMTYSQNITLNYYSPVNGDVFYVPSILLHYTNEYIYDYFFNNYTLEELEILHEMDTKLSSVDETLQQQQEYLEQEPSSEDFNTDDLPTDSGVTDTTEDGLNSFFSTFYTAFTSNPVAGTNRYNIVVPIPFTR